MLTFSGEKLMHQNSWTCGSCPGSPISKHGFCYTDSCKGNDVGSVLRVVCASHSTKNALFCNMVRKGGCASTFKRLPVRTALMSSSALAWSANLPDNLHSVHVQGRASVHCCFPFSTSGSNALFLSVPVDVLLLLVMLNSLSMASISFLRISTCLMVNGSKRSSKRYTSLSSGFTCKCRRRMCARS